MRNWRNYVTIFLTVMLVIDAALATDSDRIVEPYGTLVWPLLAVLWGWLVFLGFVAWRRHARKES